MINTLGVSLSPDDTHACSFFSSPTTHPPGCFGAISLSLSLFVLTAWQTINMLSTAAACVPGASGGVLTVSDSTSCRNNANLVAREDSLSQVRSSIASDLDVAILFAHTHHIHHNCYWCIAYREKQHSSQSSGTLGKSYVNKPTLDGPAALR